jgi:hypothetical protein
MVTENRLIRGIKLAIQEGVPFEWAARVERSLSVFRSGVYLQRWASYFQKVTSIDLVC